MQGLWLLQASQRGRSATHSRHPSQRKPPVPLARRAQIDLNATEEIRRPSSAIQVSKRGASRLPNEQEARALALGALWTLDQTAGGIKIANASDASGKSLAVIVIENALFQRDEQGFSTLKPQ